MAKRRIKESGISGRHCHSAEEGGRGGALQSDAIGIGQIRCNAAATDRDWNLHVNDLCEGFVLTCARPAFDMHSIVMSKTEWSRLRFAVIQIKPRAKSPIC